MRPLPTNNEPLPPAQSLPARRRTAEQTLELGMSAAPANQRRNSCGSQRAYPWLLVTATLLAGAFCFLYINKPVIVAHEGLAPGAPAKPGAAAADTAGLLASGSLPGDEATAGPDGAADRPVVAEPRELKNASEASSFEETNLRIQHVLGAQGPNGEDLGRVVLEVPVLYPSRTLRWTTDDVERARSLLTRIGNYQERSRALRSEAVELLTEWDQLVSSSIPAESLRADSPSLPENQGVGAAVDAPLDSAQTIRIESRPR